MDRVNLKTLQRMCPKAQRHKLRLLMEFSAARSEEEVPDPFGGKEDGFERVLDLVEDAARGLLRELHPRAAQGSTGGPQPPLQT